MTAHPPTPAAHLGGHAVGDAEGQVLQDALHAVVVLLPRGAQVLLQGPGHGGEDGLSCLPGVHHFSRRLLLLLSLETLDVDEGFLYRHYQSGRRCSAVIKVEPTAGFRDSPLTPKGDLVPTTNFSKVLSHCSSLAVLQGMGRDQEKEK